MLKRKAIALLVVLGTLGVFGVARAQRGGGSLTALDYAEIQKLYGRYAIGIDSGNVDMFTNVFTPDGTFELAGGRSVGGRTAFQGRKELAELAAGPNKTATSVSHVALNIVIEPTPEGASGSSYFLRLSLGPNGQPPNNIVAGGIYRDTFVKTSEGWRIKKRIVEGANSTPPPKAQ